MTRVFIYGNMFGITAFACLFLYLYSPPPIMSYAERMDTIAMSLGDINGELYEQSYREYTVPIPERKPSQGGYTLAFRELMDSFIGGFQ